MSNDKRNDENDLSGGINNDLLKETDELVDELEGLEDLDVVGVDYELDDSIDNEIEDSLKTEAAKSGVVIEAAQPKTPKAAVKPTAKPKATEAKETSGGSRWFKEIKAEFVKIIWPNKSELGKMTLTVIVTSLLVGAIIAGLDSVFIVVVGALLNL